MKVCAVIILVIFSLGLGCNVSEVAPESRHVTACCSETPEMVVKEFWKRAENNDLSGAGELIAAAPSKYVQPDIDRRVSNKDAERGDKNTQKALLQTGRGGADPTFKDERFAEKLRDFLPAQIFRAKWRLVSIESVRTDGDSARAVIAVTSDGFRLPLKLEVLFNKEIDGWRICSIWT